MCAQVIPSNDNRPQSSTGVKDVFGGCPHCGPTNGYINDGPDHWFVCEEHKTKWFVGSGLFSSWREESEEQHRENRFRLAEYREVVPE